MGDGSPMMGDTRHHPNKHWQTLQSAMNQFDYKTPIGVSLPQSLIKELDEKRGRLGRSTYILLLLEKALKESKQKDA